MAFPVGVGFAITAMLLTRAIHPPAGADPIVVILVGASWQFLLMPVLLGTIAIVGIAIAYHRWITRWPTRSQRNEARRVSGLRSLWRQTC